MFHHVFSLGSRNEERRVIDPRVSRSSAAYQIFLTATYFKQDKIFLLFTPYLSCFSKEFGIGTRGFFRTRAGWSWLNRSYLASLYIYIYKYIYIIYTGLKFLTSPKNISLAELSGSSSGRDRT